MLASLNKLRQDSVDDTCSAYIEQSIVLEGTLRELGVHPSNMPMRPNYACLTPLDRLEACTQYVDELAALAFKESQICMKVTDELTTAIERAAKTPLWGIDDETIGNLGEAESKKALGLAVNIMFRQERQIRILAGRVSGDEHLIKLFNKQREMYEKYAQEAEQELQQRSDDVDRISDLEEDVAKRSAEVREMSAFVKALSKKLHDVATGSATLPEEAEKECEIEELMEKRIRCTVCMDCEKDTVFVCGHAYCNVCASEWQKCTVCVTEKGNRPITFKHPLFL